MDNQEKKVIEFLNGKKWEKVVSRELSLFELYCAAVAYTKFPFKNKMDSLVVVKKGMATRYCIPSQLKQLEDDIKTTDMADVMSGCIATDQKFNDFLDNEPFNNVPEFIIQYTESWLGELLGFYIGSYSSDQNAIELSNKLRGVHNAQHRVAEGLLPLFMDYLTDKLSIQKELTKFIAPEEIIKGDISNDLLQQRAYFYILATIGNEVFIISGNGIESLIDKIISEEKINHTGDIKGQVSFPGVVSGYVKIVNTVEDMNKVVEGDILVSVMTRTNFISAMQKAAAFVTDEGGITCHAAIVARELKKPCIVGTRIASRVLKDGDMVEIDAAKGIVRKLS